MCPVITLGFPPSHIPRVSWPIQRLQGLSVPWNYIWPDRRGEDTLFLSGCKQILTALRSAWWHWWIDALWQASNSSAKSASFPPDPGYATEGLTLGATTVRKRELQINISLLTVVGKAASPCRMQQSQEFCLFSWFVPGEFWGCVKVWEFRCPSCKVYTVYREKMPQKAHFDTISFPELIQMVHWDFPHKHIIAHTHPEVKFSLQYFSGSQTLSFSALHYRKHRPLTSVSGIPPNL